MAQPRLRVALDQEDRGLGPGDDYEVIPWREGTVFTPPDQRYHQHFNVRTGNARYIAFGPPRQFGGHNESLFGSQTIKYADEEPWIRQKFEDELAQRGLKSDIPEDAYRIRDYEWDYGDDD